MLSMFLWTMGQKATWYNRALNYVIFFFFLLKPIKFFKTLVLQVIVLDKWDGMDWSRQMCQFGLHWQLQSHTLVLQIALLL